jgi:hypothetical protein
MKMSSVWFHIVCKFLPEYIPRYFARFWIDDLLHYLQYREMYFRAVEPVVSKVYYVSLDC